MNEYVKLVESCNDEEQEITEGMLSSIRNKITKFKNKVKFMRDLGKIIKKSKEMIAMTSDDEHWLNVYITETIDEIIKLIDTANPDIVLEDKMKILNDVKDHIVKYVQKKTTYNNIYWNFTKAIEDRVK